MNVSSKRNPSRNYCSHNSNSFGYKSTCSNYHHDFKNLNPIFDDLCEVAREIAKTKGLKSSMAWLYEAEKQGVISTSELVRYSKLIQARNLKNHGGSQYLQVTTKAVHDINTVIKKMNASKPRGKTNLERHFSIPSKVDGEKYYFRLCIIKTKTCFIAKISLVPHWHEVKYRLRDFQIFSSDRGCHVYSSRPVTSIEDTDELILRWANRYARKLDDAKRSNSNSICFSRY